MYQQLHPLADATILNTLANLALNKLIFYEPPDGHLEQLKIEALRSRTELSIAFGTGARDFCLNSQLWHPNQNFLAQFPGGMYQTMHRSYLGNFAVLPLEYVQHVQAFLPNIDTLNIILDLGSVNQDLMPQTIASLAALMHFYAHQLVSFKLWARGPMVPTPEGRWNSVLMQHFGPHLWDQLSRMVRCQILWLDLQEDVRPAPAGHPQPVCMELKDHLAEHQDALRAMNQLVEFRFVAQFITPYLTFLERFQHVRTLERVYIINFLTFDQFQQCPLILSKRLHEITMVAHQPVTLEEFSNLFDYFYVLTRLTLHLGPNGPRFITAFYALTKVANLQVLNLVITQPKLLALLESYLMSLDHVNPPRFQALQVLTINMQTHMKFHSTISVAGLFPGTQPGEQMRLQPFPRLVCFDMSVLGGVCGLCTDQEQCIRDAVIRWFEPLPMIALVTFENPQRHIMISGHLPDPPIHLNNIDQ